jgi:hypothetical protein
MQGLADIEYPVHASRASFCVTIQSTFPSSSMTPKVVFGVFVDIRQVSGEVEDIYINVSRRPPSLGGI